MAKKAELLAEAKKLKLEVSDRNTIAEIEKAIKSAQAEKPKKEVKEEPKVEVAKAGKRSAKAVKEAEEKQEKEDRKQVEQKAPVEKSKKVQKPARSRLERRSKKYKEAVKLIDNSKTYELKEALGVAIKSSVTKFDASVELHVNLNVDPRQADQNIRSTVVLPAGTGKTQRIAVIAEPEDVEAAKKAGADLFDAEAVFKDLDKEVIKFNVLIAKPSQMTKLGKYARLLGTKGLMPNPKSGTVTNDIAKAVKEAKAGKVGFRVDSTGIIHVAIGKVSFGVDKLEQNAQAVTSSIRAAKPATIKGIYIKSAFLTTTMGPSVKLSV